jgi:RHS repeat-associated protein
VHPKPHIGLFSNSFLNPKNEITNAILAANSFGYAYDPIGNRISATKNQEPENYFANSLNQYTQIVDGVTNLPTYDLDGNMLTYSGWTFTWNGENRLVQASNSEHVISYSYDYQGRMFQRVVDGVTNSFIWDGFNIVAEISSSQTNFNVWVHDLSQSLQGAGGVGGLLSVTKSDGAYFPCADGNGNITDYITPDGGVVAHREFDAYGNTLVATGSLVHELHFWFSSKYLDEETGLYYFGYRYYQPSTGRWLGRDPIGEHGLRSYEPKIDRWFSRNTIGHKTKGIKYTFVGNNPICAVDLFGLMTQSQCDDHLGAFERRIGVMVIDMSGCGILSFPEDLEVISETCGDLTYDTCTVPCTQVVRTTYRDLCLMWIIKIDREVVTDHVADTTTSEATDTRVIYRNCCVDTRG